ncbi:MAG: class I SAM-dependent methyltransferase [Bacteroidota bacterium]
METPNTRLTLFPESLRARYDLTLKQLHLGGNDYSILAVKDTNDLLDKIDPQAFSVDERMPYWAELWPASSCLAEICIECQDQFRGSSVLELGCGLGLAGIAAAKAGASVVFTDYENDALLFAQHNAGLNLSAELGRCAFQLFDWRAPSDLARFRCILGADLLYEERNFNPLLNILHSHLEQDGVALFTDPRRSVAERFPPCAVERGYRVNLSTRWERNAQRNIVVIEVRR